MQNPSFAAKLWVAKFGKHSSRARCCMTLTRNPALALNFTARHWRGARPDTSALGPALGLVFPQWFNRGMRGRRELAAGAVNRRRRVSSYPGQETVILAGIALSTPAHNFIPHHLPLAENHAYGILLLAGGRVSTPTGRIVRQLLPR
ncbi:hypothetical protein EJB31_25805 [Klebsiella pneumoniae]|uniref:hypothetical protein n=1 Tax=Klebsiella pneumoniae TaxID=573 RepID=UPI0013E97CD8|nr:hypothetical protein [Klebsiella pneumoniae]NGX69046.1 hypothetical protein [Klebsiella pneumoniae]